MRDASDWKRWNDLSRTLDKSLVDFNRAFTPNVTNMVRRMERNFKAAEGRSVEQRAEQKADVGLVRVPRALTSGISLGIDIPGLVRIAPEGILSMNSKISFIEKDASPTRALSLVLETGSGRRGGVVGEDAEGEGYAERVGEQLGFSQALWLKATQANFPQLLAIRGEFCIHFPATVGVRAANSWRFVPCLMFVGDVLNIYWHQVDDRARVTYIARGR